MIKIKYSKFLIIGSGPSGYTASIYLSRSNLNPILVTGDQIGGQLINTNEIENWPGLERPISGSNLMENFFNQINNLNVELIFDEIFSFNLLSKPIILIGKYKLYICDILIISMGSRPKTLSIFHEKKYLGKNIATCSICDGNFYKNKDILILGGGNVALENVIYLNNLVNKIILIHRNKIFNSEYILFYKFLKIKTINKNIIVKLNTIIFEIIGDEYLMKYVKLFNFLNKCINIISIDGLFLSIGNIVNSEKILGQLKIFNKYILNYNGLFYNYSLSSINSVFLSGDIHDFLYKQAITSSAYGCISAFDSIYYYNKLNK